MQNKIIINVIIFTFVNEKFGLKNMVVKLNFKQTFLHQFYFKKCKTTLLC